MKTRNRQRRPRARKTLLFETLESRQVMDAATGFAPDTQEPLPQFESAEALQRQLIDSAVAQWQGQFGQPIGYWRFHPLMPAFAHFDSVNLSAGAWRSADALTLNAATAGPVRPDLIQTDGEFLYTITGENLQIVDVRDPAAPQLASTFDVPGHAFAEFVQGDRLTILSHVHTPLYDPPIGVDPVPRIPLALLSYPVRSQVQVTILDISDPAAPRVAETTRLDGDFVEARALDNSVYLVLQQHTQAPPPDPVCEPTREDIEAGLQRVFELVRSGQVPVDGLAPLLKGLQDAGLGIDNLGLSTSELLKLATDLGLLNAILGGGGLGGLLGGLFGGLDINRLIGQIDWTKIDFSRLNPSNVDWSVIDPDEFNLDGVDLEAVRNVIRDFLGQVRATDRMIVRPFWDDFLETCRYETQDEYVTRIAATWRPELPRYHTRDGADAEVSSGALVAAADVYRPVGSSAQSLVSLVGFDLLDDHAGPDSAAGVLAGHATAAHFGAGTVYIATSVYRDDIVTLNTTAEFAPAEPETLIHQFVVGPTGYSLMAAGTVTGTVDDFRQMDEFDGRLRVATKTFVTGAATNVFVLNPVGASLEVEGSLTGIAPDEHLFAVSFDGSRGYLVTFRQIDPLFTLDLSDPANPTIAGELMMPGFSRHLRGIGGRFLLGTGQDADVDNGFAREPQVSLFDVGDLSQPQIRDRFEFEFGDGVSSSGVWDDQAIGYFAEHGLLAVPVSFSRPHGIPIEPPIGIPLPWFEGFGFEGEVTEGTFTPLLTMATDILVDGERPVIDLPPIDPVFPLPPPRWEWTPQWELVLLNVRTDEATGDGQIELNTRITTEMPIDRTLVFGDYLYALGREGLQVHRLSDPQPVVARLSWGPLVAQPDHARVEKNSADNRVDVLANDSAGATALTITNVTEPIAGGTVTIESGESGRQWVTYTPPSDYVGRDAFAYTITDAQGRSATTRVHIGVHDPNDDGGGGGGGGDTGNHGPIMVRLAANDANGGALTSVAIGETFFVDVYVQDMRSSPDGVFAAYVDVGYDGGLAEPIGDIVHSSQFANGVSGNSSVPGLLDEVGGFSGVNPTGGSELLVARIPMRATASGVLRFDGNLPDERGHEILVFGENTNVPPEFVGFAGTSIEVTGESILSPMVAFRFEAVDADGNVLTDVTQGDDFRLNVYVQDIRTEAQGVFSAYFDVGFDGTRVAHAGVAHRGEGFRNAAHGAALAGAVDEFGGFGGVTPNGAGELLVASFPMKAMTEGPVEFAGDFADQLGHEVLLYGRNRAVPASAIQWREFSLHVKPGWHNPADPTDVTGDGSLTPADALEIIYELRTNGFRTVDELEQEFQTAVLANSPLPAEGEPGRRKFLDVTRDRVITPLDALNVINALIRAHLAQTAAEGEPVRDTTVTSAERRAEPTASSEEFVAPVLAAGDGQPVVTDDRTASRVIRQQSVLPMAESPIVPAFVWRHESLRFAMTDVLDELAADPEIASRFGDPLESVLA